MIQHMARRLEMIDEALLTISMTVLLADGMFVFPLFQLHPYAVR